MSAVLNSYLYGYVAVPVIISCIKNNLFKIVSSSEPVHFNDIVENLHANRGHLRVALQMMESLRWISRNDNDEYLLSQKSDIHRKIPEDITKLLSFPMHEYVSKNQKKHSIKKWIAMSAKRWNIEDTMFADFLDGMLAIPLLLALKKNNFLVSKDNHQAPLFSVLSPAVREEIIKFFTDRGWLVQEGGAYVFTDTGRFITERISILEMVASYRPMLANISEVIFGDCKAVFTRDENGSELHIDPDLNVKECCFQHENHFSDIEEMILSIFNRKPITEQPKYIANMGCGDGTLLKRIYEVIKNKSLRGEVLHQYPIKLIAMDRNEEALMETTHTLENIDHLVLKGDIADPLQAIADLKNYGIQDTENILHVRSFLDHDRPYVPPSDTAAANARLHVPSKEVFVSEEGTEIPAASVMQSLVEHFGRWSEISGKHGLILLEAHSLDPKTTGEFLDVCESLNMDEIHRFSQQQLVEAGTFLMAAAEAGLFPDEEFFRKYPKTLPFSRNTLNYFKRMDYRMRYAKKADLPVLEKLEEQCWEHSLRMPSSVLEKRIEQYPQGQLVLELDNRVVGAIYSQRIDNTEDLKSVNFETVGNLHRKDGAIIQLLALNVFPDMQHRNLGGRLLEFMLQRSSLVSGVCAVVGVTRCKNYDRHSHLSPQEYMNLRNPQGRLVDTVLRMHESHGAQIIEAIPGYRPQDIKNKGYGVLVKYDVFNRRSNDIHVGSEVSEMTVKKENPEKLQIIRDFILKTVAHIHGGVNREDLLLEQPLMELGLDSGDLMELNEQISYKFNIPLESTFFFKYNTMSKIIMYLQERVEFMQKADLKTAGTFSTEQDMQGDSIIGNKRTDTVCKTMAKESDIAIIGVACRLPGGIKSKEQLWELLEEGRDAIGKLPAERWEWPANINPDHEHKGIDMGGFLDDIAAFEAAFFRISPKEAELMDPQQRILLELSWQCIEDAGYAAKALSGSKTGVFIGASGSDYSKLLDKRMEEVEAHFGVGTSLAVMPNRISYFYDFHGPSIQIDTACSSSLVAVHQAVKSLCGGECGQALVGGINILCDPSSSIAYYKAGMLAKDGRCKTFNKEANGYVRSEGAVMMLLKPLGQALADQDNVYAVIKGTAINHGGQSGGLTVPNPDKQAALLVEAYKTAGIEPETVSYIEAHGTGTSLGDPIEISGLKEAFSELSKVKEKVREPYCGLGSIKTNIGHLEAAAGIAGILKVVLSMRHRRLPASIHFSEINPHIILSKTPFYIVSNSKPWQPDDSRFLLRAGISSFGSGGTNAHVVLEEAPAQTRQAHKENPAYMICLSAKTEEALRQKERDLVLWLEKEGRQNSLAVISGTLLLGREHFGERAAYIVKDIQELKKKLNKAIETRQAEGYFRESHARKGKQRDQDSEELGRMVLKELGERKNVNEQEYGKKLTVLAEMYVKGHDLDWGAIFEDERLPHISLPLYPFSGERYWVTGKGTATGSAAHSTARATIHPLLHQNTSDFSKQRFSSTFTGREFFLADHMVKGQRVLPGVAYLEMARAAVEKASGPMENIRLKNIVWMRPITVKDRPVEVHIVLYPEDNGEISYEIYSGREDGSQEFIVHSQGRAVKGSAGEIGSLNIKALQTECGSRVIPSARCYAAFKSIGLDYGAGHQGITELYAGQGQVLAKLSLPSSILDTQNHFVLHPALMDSALQAAFMINSGEMGLALPFELQEVEMYEKCTPEMWACVQYSDGSKAEDGLQKLDIDLCDATGKICVRLKGYSSKVLKGDIDLAGHKTAMGTLMLEPVWKEQAAAWEAESPEYTRHLVMLWEEGEVFCESIQTQMGKVRCLSLQSGQSGMDARFQDYAVQIFEEIKNIFKEKSGDKVFVQVVTATQGEGQLFSGLFGLLKTAGLENPMFAGQLIEVEYGESTEGIIEKLKENSRCSADSHIRYRNGKRYIAGWSEVKTPQEDAAIPWKDKGVYLITGGTGGLGLIFAGEIAHKVKDATVIVTGRSALDRDKQAQMKELEAEGARIEYRQVDVTQRDAVYNLIRSVEGDFGGLSGILHCAGIIKDSLISKKTKTEFLEVLAPKVAGLVNLDEASRGLPLDFFVLFSSMVGALGNLGQADYSAANGFMDAYAEYRNTLVASGQRHGQTLSVNWPLWEEGGMRVDAEAERMLLQNLGLAALQTERGVLALYQCLASKKSQVMVLEGKLARMRQKLLSVAATAVTQAKKSASDPQDDAGLMGKLHTALMRSVSKVLKVKLEDIDLDTDLDEYGFDSITYNEFSNKMNDEYKLELTPAIFFGYPTLRSFAGYLLEKHRTVLAAQFTVQAGVEAPVQELEYDGEESPKDKRRRPRFAGMGGVSLQKPEGTKGGTIAIIGISGIFPGARDVNELWRNLLEGKDCITEIPKDRWDWREYYGDPKKEENKTNVKWGGFIDGVDEFDPQFFSISPREAELMNPHQRLLMTYVWKAIEDAGYSPQSLSGTKTGIFVGTFDSGYSKLLSAANVAIESYSSTGMIPSVGPNRMSYFLNFHGPSEPIETACSSSLVAIHRAVNAIENGNCEMAIVGGINTMITPELHISFSKAGMLCEDGRCKTFSDKANGYVRGEGAGIIFLKKLKAAEQAGDHIYGVIRSTFENHGGRANSLTAPNPNAQAELLKTVYTRAGIDPRTVTYIEAHGTGTELGDPIEINSLKAAFKELYKAWGETGVSSSHCGLGSVKTNIGHLELAAGIAGVIKVLLQLKYKTLVKSLHCDTVNPYIQLTDSPFYIVRETGEWKAVQDAEGNVVPRRAGVSSFGFGGVNAHVVIEEYMPSDGKPAPIGINGQNPAIIVLSAKNKERLKEQAKQLLNEIEAKQISDADLADIAYTLQVGREHMEERIGLIVTSVNQIQKKLKGFVEDKEDIEDLYYGQVKRNKEMVDVFAADEELREAMVKWIQRRKYDKLLELWVKGLTFDWHILYGDTKPHRISLPTYPFARERYWVPRMGTKAGGAPGAAAAALLHPILHKNTSDLYGPRFSSIFTGQEFFLADHVVGGRKLLPGVAYLEMARAAVEQSLGGCKEGKSGIRLKNIVWARPIVAGDRPVQVHIELFPEENGEISYEIFSDPEESGAASIVHSQGSAVPGPVGEAAVLDIKALLAECSQNTISSAQCYEAFRKAGLDYGPGHRGIEKLYLGQEQVLAKLSLPLTVSDAKDGFILHPGMMDSALQASLGLLPEPAAFSPFIPFALEEVEIYGKSAAEMWAVVGYSKGCKSAGAVKKLDIDICDPTGKICVRMKGLLLRALEGETDGVGLAATFGTLLLQPDWKEKAVAGSTKRPDYLRHLVIICEPCGLSQEDIEVGLKAELLMLQSRQQAIEARFQTYVENVFEQINGILKNEPVGNVLVQVVVSMEDKRKVFSGISGLLKTARLENPKFVGQLVEVEPDEDTAGIIAKLRENSKVPGDSHTRYRGGKRYVAGWSQIEAPLEEAAVPWKDRGVYLITGGAGGLGLIFAREIAHKVKGATVILTGRSALNKDRQVQLKELEAGGTRIEYRQVDVAQRDAVCDLIKDVRDDFGNLNGILHCAGIIKDNFIVNKTKEELLEVVAPKVAGLVNLDEASRELPLDFFLLFSSIAGALGNQGQADYAAANAFMDAYAEYRNGLVEYKLRYGRTLSVNWPLWREGGMQVDARAEEMMLQNSGLTAMETTRGIQALYQCLASSRSHVMVLEGRLTRMRQKLLSPEPAAVAEAGKAPTEPLPSTGMDTGSLRRKVQEALRKEASGLLKVKAEDIDVTINMEEYGFDSFAYIEFANKLNEKYKLELTPAVFFGYPTLQSFADYLVGEYQAVFAARFTEKTTDEGSVEEDSVQDAEYEVQPKLSEKRRRSRFAAAAPKPEAAGHEPVAIVGMSGIFPKARDLDEFWKNLSEAEDCITEIPKERWDWREYYGDPAKEANKTNIKWGGFIEGVDEFDPQFFGISPREAELMDPQQRLLMTYVWKAIEDAGYCAQSLSGTKTGIFVGTAASGYSNLLARANVAIEGSSSTGMAPSVGPNRMSYFLNIHGPSEPIETACSSSLVAIHRAVSAILDGTCEMAIAGGVNVILNPELHISFNKAGMLCEDGRCKTFSDKANGYVRGEGAGIIFLKKLKAAEQAGDHIYGVIRSTFENHGGRANSLTAPNPNAQAELLKTVYTRAGIDPRTVTYIEAHGTGTELGDPIEINSLKAAFKELYKAWGETGVSSSHCGLGSVKTNIGHLELAAGIAGVIKVLLQLKYKTLVKSLHCDTVNPYIQLTDSPFYIVRETGEWKAVQDAEGNSVPRRAGVSSFGFGGANAHVVIEEYIPDNAGRAQAETAGQNPVIIVLSAKNIERLKEQAQQLLNAVTAERFTDVSLADAAYTLQVGRQHMEERLGLIVTSVGELQEKLKEFVEGRSNIEGLYYGQFKRNKEALFVLAADEDIEKTIDAWIAKGKYTKLLDLWVRGLAFDWNKLYGGLGRNRISLPTYPFARERYWIPEAEAKTTVGCTEAAPGMTAAIHPLLHQNTSHLLEQRFSSTFTGEEFFLRDHIVKGQRILAGAACLEMARAAAEESIRALKGHKSGMVLKNVVWVRPIIAGTHPVQVHTGLYLEDNGEISYKIYSEPGEAGVIHSQGRVVIPGHLGMSAILDIKALQAECSRSTVSSVQCYDAFKEMGIDYGPGYRCIEELYVGPGKVLAKLSLPSALTGTITQFVLHPCMVDSAIQASLGLMPETGSNRPSLAFALEELEIVGSCTPAMWAYVRYSEDCKAGGKVQKLDIDLCGESGKVCIRIKGFASRTLEGDIQTANGLEVLQPVASTGALSLEPTLLPVWDVTSYRKVENFPSPQDKVVLIGGTEKDRESVLQLYPNAGLLEISPGDSAEDIAGKLETKASFDHIVYIASGYAADGLGDLLIQGGGSDMLQCFRMIKALLRSGYGNRSIGLSIITLQGQPVRKGDLVNPYHAGVHGLIGSMTKEYPNWKVRLVDLEGDFRRPVTDIFTLPADVHGNVWAYRGKEWYRQKLVPLQQSKPGGSLYRHGGVYVVVGGAGGIGKIWTEYMIRTYQARIVWIGRREKDGDIQAELDSFSAIGPVPCYISADAADPKALQRAYEEIKQSYSQIHGVIHSAVGVLDQSLANMEEKRFLEGLSAKVNVSVNIARIFNKEPLDFVMFFSSLSAFAKEHGKSSYSAGCNFMDAFAHRLSREWTCAVRVMNWGYWEGVGIANAVPEAFKKRLEQTGIQSITAPAAMEALEMLLAGSAVQNVWVKTTKPGAVEGVLDGETVKVYTENYPSDIENIMKQVRSGIKRLHTRQRKGEL